jgi:hypothetical protein
MTYSPASSAAWKPVDWLGLHAEVPDDWEIVKHSTKFGRGTLVFVDRRRQRMQLSWAACATPPDAERIFDDFRARDRQEHPGCDVGDSFRLLRWTGYRRNTGGRALTRAGCYDRQYRRWIDVALPWPHGYEANVERAVLESFRTVKSDGGDLMLDAFDLAVTVPAGWRLAGAAVAPTRVTFTLTRGETAVMVRRIAMPEAWFDGQADQFLRRQAAPIGGSCALTRVAGHEAATFEGRERVVHPRWLWGKRKERRDLAWECPGDHAVYHVVVTRYPRDSVEPADFAVRCCRAGAV